MGADVDRVEQFERPLPLAHTDRAGTLTTERVHAKLGTVGAGRRPGRTSERQITIADLTGVGFQDTAIAAAALAGLAQG